MTPEERFIRMENLLQAMTEHHARHHEELLQHSEQIAKHSEQIAKHSEQIAKHSEQIEKNTAGIRDLIVISRTVVTSIQELRHAQASTDERLNLLIDTIDRIIARLNGK